MSQARSQRHRQRRADDRPVGFDPRAGRQFILGQRTLGELEGISKGEQYDIARVGYAHLEDGQLGEAETVFEGLLALDPYDAYFLTALGVIAQRQERLERADRCFSRALEINPFSTTALANRGEVRLKQGRLVEAADDLVRALEEDRQGEQPSTVRARALVATMQSEIRNAVR
ncbi:MAG: tetratricopeptide repeat protein [Acidobacteriota bacterium]